MAPKRRNSAASVAPEVDASTGKRARKQTIEQLAAKAIKDSCKGMSEEMTHVVRNAKGESLFEVVVQELQKQKALGLSRLGALRWREIRDQFRQLAGVGGQFQLPKEAEEICPTLFRAVIACKRAHPDRALLQLWLASSSGACNKTSIVGLFKLALEMNPRCQRQLPVCLDVCRYVMRVNIMTVHPAEAQIMEPWMDSVLTASFRASGLRPSEFLRIHQGLLTLVLPAAPLKKVMDAHEAWDKVVDELAALTASSFLGQALFSFAVLKTLGSRVQSVISSGLLGLFDAKFLVTRVRVDDFRKKIMERLEKEVGNLELLPPKRVVDIMYRGQTFAVKVNSLGAHVSLACAAAWKTLALNVRELKPCWADEMIWPGGGPLDLSGAAKVQVEEELCTGAQKVREQVDALYLEEEGANGSSIIASLRPKFAKFYINDPEFQVEAMLMECVCGEGAAGRLTSQVLAILPEPDRLVSLASAIQKLNVLSGSAVFKIAPKAAQAKVSNTLKWLGRILDGRPPDFETTIFDEAFGAIIEKIAYFAVATGPAKRGEEQVQVLYYGKAATKFMIEGVQKKFADGGCKLDDISDLKVWKYLMTGDQTKEAANLIEEVEKHIASSGKASEKAKKKAAPEGSKKDAAVQQAMALFTR